MTCAAISLLVLSAALLPATVFADDADAAPGAEASAVTTAAETTAAAAADAAGSALIAGKVTEVREHATDSDEVRITVDDGKGGVVLNISELLFVYDQKTDALVSLSDVEKDMEIAAVLPANSPMAQSMPPQTGAVYGLILNSNADEYKLDVFDADLVSGDGNLKLNIGADTKVYFAHKQDTEVIAPDSELLVFYTVVATSQPAQTTPSRIIVLTPAAAVEKDAETPAEPAAEAEYVGLRAAAEAKGYTVTWTSNKAPITLTKGDVTATVTIGSDAFTYTHLTRDMQPLDSVDKLDLPTQLDGSTTVVADTFIELLK
jgi:hypothetical protein